MPRSQSTSKLLVAADMVYILTRVMLLPGELFETRTTEPSPNLRSAFHLRSTTKDLEKTKMKEPSAQIRKTFYIWFMKTFHCTVGQSYLVDVLAKANRSIVEILTSVMTSSQYSHVDSAYTAVSDLTGSTSIAKGIRNLFSEGCEDERNCRGTALTYLEVWIPWLGNVFYVTLMMCDVYY